MTNEESMASSLNGTLNHPTRNLSGNFECDNALDDKEMTKARGPGYLDILDFHPHNEIIFFSGSMEIGLAYHLNTSKFQVLENLYPTRYHDFVSLLDEKEIIASFPYTPCLV
jgi:hypothetical protein